MLVVFLTSSLVDLGETLFYGRIDIHFVNFLVRGFNYDLRENPQFYTPTWGILSAGVFLIWINVENYVGIVWHNIYFPDINFPIFGIFMVIETVLGL